MCRRNQLPGWALLAFGAGLLLGTLISSHFWCGCIGIAAAVFGFVILKRN